MRDWRHKIDFRPIVLATDTTMQECAANLHAYLETWRKKNKNIDAVVNGYIELDEIMDILVIQKDQPDLHLMVFNSVVEDLYHWCDENSVWVIVPKA